MTRTSNQSPACRKLAHIYHLAFNIPQLTKAERVGRGDGVVEVMSPFVETCTIAGIVPFWEETCPPEYEAHWGASWDSIRERMQQLAAVTSATKIAIFDWQQGGMMPVLTWAREAKVIGCFDSPVCAELVSVNSKL